MAVAKTDVVVLGAGVVGVSAALHLQARGRDVVVVDRRGAAAGETSYGNTGVIQAEAVFPYMFPRALGEIAKAALNRDLRAQVRYSALPAIAPFVWRYFLASTPQGRERSAKAARPLIARALPEHKALAAAAGAEALLSNGGWIKAFRTESGREAALKEVDEMRPFGVDARALDRPALAALEPHLSEAVLGGVHFVDPATTPDPGSLVNAYAALFLKRGGRLIAGDARSFAASSDGWSVATTEGPLAVREAVVALGAWSSDVYEPLGYRFPLGVKRGYHMHYGAKGNAALSRPVLDVESGYVLAPMTRGIRLTTGAEFARRDDPPSSAHLDRLEPLARTLFPLAERRDAAPWLGRRPCMPDMLPIIGPAARHKGLWLDFGHHHHGLTLGPISGRLIAEMMTGEAPSVDPAPFSGARFG
ncbi:MAG TPA: FAD-dependent oxidoreductase [Roseiarcus sp.]|nr:FAD-dependent oxidoreductase [Roseiarcus sp.]